MAVEHAPEHRRGFYGAWPQVGRLNKPGNSKTPLAGLTE